MTNIRGDRKPWDSPCKRNCTTQFGGDVCKGCGRTVEEIRIFNSQDRDSRMAINERAKKRALLGL